MAAPFLRLGRLSEQHLRMESSFGILRRTPSVVNFSTKAGDPKKPIRYTSIKKAKPKTVIDIGKLLLQKANDAKVNKQSVIAEAALKASTQTAQPTASEQSPAFCEPVAAATSTQKAPAASSNGGSVAATFVEATPKISDAMEPPVMSVTSKKGSNETTSSVEQQAFPEYVGQETEPTSTKNPPTDASLKTPFEASTGEMAESPQEPVHRNDSKDVASPLRATPDAVPIDVTYSEEAVPVSDITDIGIASPKPSVGVLSATGTMTTEIVGAQTVSAVDVPAFPEVLLPEISPAEHSATKVTPTAEGVEIIYTLEDAASTPPPSSEDVRVEVSRTQPPDVRPETPVDFDYVASSSKLISEEVLSPVVPYEDTQALSPKDVVSSSDFEKAALSDSVSIDIPVGMENQPTAAKISGDLGSQAEERVLDPTPEMISEALAAPRSPDPADGKFAEEEALTVSSEAQLDPVKRLFLDKIREYNTKSRAHHGLVDAGPEYEKAFSEELTKLQRLYGNGDLTAFPEFKFPEPVLDDVK